MPSFQHTFINYFSVEGFLERSYYIVELNITLKKKEERTTVKQELPMEHYYVFEATFFHPPKRE